MYAVKESISCMDEIHSLPCRNPFLGGKESYPWKAGIHSLLGRNTFLAGNESTLCNLFLRRPGKAMECADHGAVQEPWDLNTEEVALNSLPFSPEVDASDDLLFPLRLCAVHRISSLCVCCVCLPSPKAPVRATFAYLSGIQSRRMRVQCGSLAPNTTSDTVGSLISSSSWLLHPSNNTH